MDRRRFVAGIGGALAWPTLALAQKPARMPVIAILSLQAAPTPEQEARGPFSVIARLREFGWTEGKNIDIERAYADGNVARLSELAADLVRKRVDVIFSFAPEPTVAAARATKAIPIVFWGINYPVELGLADSFSRPGRNVTGIAFFAGVGVSTKIFEFLREIAPGVKRVAGLASLGAVETVSGERFSGGLAVIESAARSLGLDFRLHDTRTREDFDKAFTAIIGARAQAVVAFATAATFRESQRIIEFANRSRLPSAFQVKEHVEAGGLFSYGPDLAGTIRQSVSYVDRILRGARPADLPVELPSVYELAINQQTAKALGFAIPQSVLLRADRVIE